MNWTGALHIQAAVKRERTILTDRQFQGAFKITRPVYLDASHPTVYCIHVGGGYVDGDRYHTNIALEESAELTVTTQSSTKVYKTPREPVCQYTTISLKSGSVLEYLPDPLIAYEGARFLQETTVHMEKGASLIYSDIITPGWAKSRKYFRYDWIRSKLKIYEEGKLQLFDHLFLKPHDQDVSSILQMEGYTHFGSLLILHPDFSQLWMNELEEILTEYAHQVRVGMSATKIKGAVIRILAHNTPVIEHIFQACIDFIRSKRMQSPLCLRKY
ncbi:urease accessory protein UreD [Ectobacillus panaciterrae]|uniref:urease accessory protein UreD n=1 Tax=Ectobacillus panaciterrae TaxID=363872 RepID=UPI00041ECC15|nr:urease accessory protein UreD [Ectobacillus panaciterrae]